MYSQDNRVDHILYLCNISKEFIPFLFKRIHFIVYFCYVLFGQNGLGAKLVYMGYFASLLHPPGRKTWLLFSVRDMSWGLRNPCFTKFSVVSFL